MPTLEIIIKAVDQASGVFGNINKGSEDIFKTIEQNATKIGLAMAGAGAGLEAFARMNRETNLQVSKLAEGLGMSDKAFRDLAVSARGAGEPMSEVLDLMSLGKKEGLSSAESLKKFTEQWDAVADATGGNAVEMAKASVSLRAVGIEAGQTDKAFSAFGLVQSKTTLGVQTFIDAVGKAAPEMNRCGMTVDDAAKAFAFLESKGITGRKAIGELNTAMKDSDGTAAGVYKQLGMNTEVQGEYNLKLDASKGYIDKNAAAFDNSFTPMQKMQEGMENLIFKSGGFISQMAQFAPILIGAGSALTFLGSAGIIGEGGLLASAGGVTALGAAIITFMPYIAGIALAIAALYLVWTNNFGGIQEKTGAAVSYLQDRFSAMSGALTKAGEAIWGALGKIWESVSSVFGNIMNAIQAITGSNGFDLLGKVIRILSAMWDAEWKAIGIVLKLVADVIVRVIGIVCDKINALIGWMVELSKNPAFKIIVDAAKWFGEKVGQTLDTVSGFLETSSANMDAYAGNTQGAFEKTEAKVKAANTGMKTSTKEMESAVTSSLETTAKKAESSADRIAAAYNRITGNSAASGGQTMDQIFSAWSQAGQSVSALEGQKKEMGSSWTTGNQEALDAAKSLYDELKKAYQSMAAAGTQIVPVGTGAGGSGSPGSSSTGSNGSPGSPGYQDNGSASGNVYYSGLDWLGSMLGSNLNKGVYTGAGSGFADNLIGMKTADGRVVTTSDYRSFQSYASEEDAKAGRGGTSYTKADYEKQQADAAQKKKSDAEEAELKAKAEALKKTLEAEVKDTETRIAELKRANEEEIAKSRAALELKLKRQQEDVDIEIARKRLELSRQFTQEYDALDEKLSAEKGLTKEQIQKKKDELKLEQGIEKEALEAKITEDKEDRDLKNKREWEDLEADIAEEDAALAKNIEKEEKALEQKLAREDAATMARVLKEDAALDARIAILNSAARQAAALMVANAAGGTATIITSSARIPMMAAGGSVLSGGSVLVGEAGAELINLPAGASVTPLSGGGDVVALLKAILNKLDSAGGGVTIQAGTIVADKGGLRELERRLRDVRVSENVRMGI